MKKFAFVWLFGFPLWVMGWAIYGIAWSLGKLAWVFWNWSYRLRGTEVQSRLAFHRKDETGGGSGGIQGNGSRYP